MWNLPTIHWLNDMTACFLGILLNLLLIFVNFRSAGRKNLRSYSHLVVVSAVFDVLFSIGELLTLHQLVIMDGIMLIMPMGPERYLHKYVGPLLMIPHCFVGMHGLWILPAQYHFRYVIITNGEAPMRLLLRNVAVTSSLAFGMSLFAYYGAYQAEWRRGYDYYLGMVTDKTWFDSNGTAYFKYVNDFRDSATVLFFFCSFTITCCCFSVSIYYAWKAWKFVRTSTQADLVSGRTARLQAQFTRSLVAQTINAMIFSAMPISIMCVSVLFHLNYKWSGLWVMSLISWLSTANALLTIVIIKAFRGYFLRLIGFETLAKFYKTTTVDSTSMQNRSAAAVSAAANSTVNTL